MENKVMVLGEDETNSIYVMDLNCPIDGCRFTVKRFKGEEATWHPAFAYPERLFNLPHLEDGMSSEEIKELSDERNEALKNFKYSEDNFQKEAR